jgi:uncharacterized protein (DUF433 family)
MVYNMAMDDIEVDAAEWVAVDRQTAARLAGASPGQVAHWRRTGLVTPSMTRRVGNRAEVILYDLGDVIQLRVVAALRSKGLSLQHIRKVVAHLRRDYDAPLRELRFAEHGGEIYFQHPDGSWEGDRQPDQMLIHEVIPLDEWRLRMLRAASRRPEADHGRVVRRRNVRGHRPVFAGTRIPVSAVHAFLEDGADEQEIIEAYPQLVAADIAAARKLLAS